MLSLKDYFPWRGIQDIIGWMGKSMECALSRANGLRSNILGIHENFKRKEHHKNHDIFAENLRTDENNLY